MTSRIILRQNIYLIGDVDTQIIGNKLPSKLQVLKIFFYHIRILKFKLRESAEICIDEVKVFWQKAQIPTKRKDHCIDQLLKLYEHYQLLQKSKSRDSNKIKEDEFKTLLLNLFDIAHANTALMVNENVMNFLTEQRKDGRVGYIANIESDDNDQAQKMKDELLQLRREKSEREKARYDEFVEFTSSSEVEGVNPLSQKTILSVSNFSDELATTQHQESTQFRGTMNIVDDKLVAVFDHCKISDRNAVRVIVALCSSLQIDVNPLIVNRSSIRRSRVKIREEKVKQIKELFKTQDLNASVLHWDGKILKTSSGKNKERLPVVLSCGQIEKILAIPVLDDGTGQSQADAMFDAINDWGIPDFIKALCCDTTAANLGSSKGAAVSLERLLEKKLLYLPCRHHIFELILRGVFELKIPTTSGPDVPLFKRFRESWGEIDISQYSNGIEDSYVQEKIQNHIDDINHFIQKQLDSNQPREDYRELLELVQIFIVYIKAWFTCPLASEAPNNDLSFLKELIDYQSTDAKISEVALKKFSMHLWYLNPETVAMAFFDERISSNIKNQMVIMLKSIDTNSEINLKRFEIKNIRDVYDWNIASFVSSRSLQFFERFGINTDFLNLNPSEWCQNEDYQKGLLLVRSLKVVNDIAERAVKLIEEYHSILSKDPERQQFIVQYLSEYEQYYADTRKSAITENMKMD
ncbi:hypothetical protein CcBV_30.5 [Bracoviriform congregatae]|uniref:Uncharacterized protein n=1 Tax=Bracoviriform congregatae TaxID=39640 RepID=Q5ZNV5_9VIRU|nr:hypothetical protein CcBV_30.5 [Bracoviriform congregatae]CAG17501.1 hypothetical protein CcBV_30.5 [Bracoviriform congregatae]